MKEPIKVNRLRKDIWNLEKKVKRLKPSIYKNGMLRYIGSLSNSVQRLGVVTAKRWGN